MTDSFDYGAFRQAAIRGLYEGRPLTGENGLFAPMLKYLLETALEGEIDATYFRPAKPSKIAETARIPRPSRVVPDCSN